MRFRHFLLRIAVCLALVGSSGCAAVLVGGAAAGTVVYVRGALQASIDGALAEVVRATGQTIDRLKLARIDQTIDGLQANFSARTAQDKLVKVHLKKITERQTSVTIRVGTFGDQTMSQNILNEIRKAI